MFKPQRKVLLNPGPATTSQGVKEALVVTDICPREDEFGELLAGIRDDLVKVVNGGSEYTAVLFGGSGTASLEAAICSAVPHGGKLLVVENGAYGTRMVQIAETHGIDVVRYSLPYGDYPDVGSVDRILAADPGITHLGVVQHETTTGMRNPVEAFLRSARRHGVQVIVDAISSYAGLPIDLGEGKIDYLVSSANKCIQGMPGISFVICLKEALSRLQGNRRSFYLDLYAQHRFFETTGQMQFTPPVQVAYALRRALDEYLAETPGGRFRRYRENWDTLSGGLRAMGFSFLLSEEHQSRLLLAVREPRDPAYTFQEMHDYLYARGFTIYPGKGAKQATFRLAVIGDLRKSDIQDFLTSLAGYLAEYGITRF